MQEFPMTYSVVNGLNMMAALATHSETREAFAEILADIYKRTNRSPEDIMSDLDAAYEFIQKANDSAIMEVNTTDTKLDYVRYKPHEEENE